MGKENGEREQWSSRAAFYFAAVGSAVGFGNVWRFPALSVQYGGGAFFIPYLMALFLIGLPILILEIGFGQYFQTGDIGVFGGFHRRLRGVGLSSVACGFMLTVYYSMLIVWVVHAFFDSFGNDDPWSDPNVNGTVAINYFIGEIIGAKTVGDDMKPTRLVGANIGYSALVWFIIFLCIAFGVEVTGKLTYVTMGLPVIFLFIFLGKSVSLEGSSDGIEEYIGKWDVSVLTEEGDVWSTAVSQIFFSLGVTFGIMTAFGSYLPAGEPVFLNSCVVAFSNSLFSFISGFAVFAALGHLSYTSGIPVQDLPFAGFSLVFGTWPVVLGQMPGGEHWVRLLFFDLFLLGIDSAFALLEASVTVICDTTYFQGLAKWKAVGFLCTCGFLLSFIYATDAGLNFLDAVDFYINFVMLIVGFFECFGAGWVYGHERTIAKCGIQAYWSYMIANFGGVIVACGLWFGLDVDDGAIWGGFVALFVWYFAGMGVTMYFVQQNMPEASWGERFWEIGFQNIFHLKDLIAPVVGWIPSAWCFLIKQFCPHVLIILFINLARTQTSNGPIFGNYGGYPMRPYQALGFLVFFFALFLFLIGMVFPVVYDCFTLPEGHLSLEKDEDGNVIEGKEDVEGSNDNDDKKEKSVDSDDDDDVAKSKVTSEA